MTRIKPHELRHATRCDGGDEHPTGAAGYYRVVAEDNGTRLSAPARNIVARAALVELRRICAKSSSNGQDEQR